MGGIKMKKRALSLLLVLILLVSMPGMAFAGLADIKGYTIVNPLGINSEMKITDLKTPNGTWKNASIKVSEVQIDNVGYKKYNSLQNLYYPDSVLSQFDALKVKVTYIFSGFSGNQNSLIKDNLLVKQIGAINSNGVYLNGGQAYSGFNNALNNNVEKYLEGGKIYKGKWYSKKIKDVNFSKPVTMTGYVYILVYNGKLEGAKIHFMLYPQKDSAKEEVYFVSSNQMLASKVKSTGNYIYGDDAVGIIKADFEMKAYNVTEWVTDGSGSGNVIKGYRVGTEKAPIVNLVMFKSAEIFKSKEAVDQYIEDMSEAVATKYEIEKYKENGNYIVQGISKGFSEYVSVHLINKGKYFLMITIKSEINEKANADKLWASYKANNDLSVVAKATSKTTEGFVYGTKALGKITSPEELYEVKASQAGALKYQSKLKDCIYSLNCFVYNKEFVEKLESEFNTKFSDATIVKLDQGNVIVYNNDTDPMNCYTVMTVVKNGNLYLFTIEVPQSKLPTHKAPVIKSYLLSLGYTASEVDAIMSDPIFK